LRDFAVACSKDHHHDDVRFQKDNEDLIWPSVINIGVLQSVGDVLFYQKRSVQCGYSNNDDKKKRRRRRRRSLRRSGHL
jgi:hypothetical protein